MNQDSDIGGRHSQQQEPQSLTYPHPSWALSSSRLPPPTPVPGIYPSISIGGTHQHSVGTPPPQRNRLSKELR